MLPGVQGPGEPFCILDCILHQANQTYYVMDIMCWKVGAVSLKAKQAACMPLKDWKAQRHVFSDWNVGRFSRCMAPLRMLQGGCRPCILVCEISD